MKQKRDPIAVAITGASGSAYALRLLEALIAAEKDIYLMVSQAGQIVLKMESDLDLPGQPAEMEKQLTQRFHATPGQLQVFGRQQWMAPVASGSNPPAAMVVCPVPPVPCRPLPVVQATI